MWKSRRLSVGISTKRLLYNFAISHIICNFVYFK